MNVQHRLARHRKIDPAFPVLWLVVPTSIFSDPGGLPTNAAADTEANLPNTKVTPEAGAIVKLPVIVSPTLATREYHWGAGDPRALCRDVPTATARPSTAAPCPPCPRPSRP
jgi:hypothetical protein